jgi:CheY-like chemotaxis protein
VAKRILVVAHNRPLKETRVSLLESQGYRVESVETDDDAMTLLETEHFDLVLLGHQSSSAQEGHRPEAERKISQPCHVENRTGRSAS